jgi:hypothetical protein
VNPQGLDMSVFMVAWFESSKLQMLSDNCCRVAKGSPAQLLCALAQL